MHISGLARALDLDLRSDLVVVVDVAAVAAAVGGVGRYLEEG